VPEGIKNAILIYNPTSGRKRHRRFADVEQAGRILKQAGIATELAPTTGPQAATKMARQAVEQSRDLVIGCGGDGTINEIVNGLAGSNVPLALLPAGTANILAKELGIPWDIPQAARLIPSGLVRRIALGLAIPAPDHLYTSLPRAGRYFLCVAGAGPDGAIVNNVDEILKKNAGVVAYWVEGLKQIFTYGFPDLQVRSAEKQHRATIIVIGRTANYGGPFKITTGASLFEDSFEVLTNSMHSRLGYVTCLPALWMGNLRNKKEVEAWKTTEVICEPAGTDPVFAQVDGEPVGPLPITFRIVPDALSLLTPAPPGN
jgi:YegS/Rv2252/BmrU family lipid kinase